MLLVYLPFAKSFAIFPRSRSSSISSSVSTVGVKAASSSEKGDGDDGDDIPDDMESVFKKLLDISKGPEVASSSRQQENQPIIGGPKYSTEQLEQLVKKMEAIVEKTPDIALDDGDGDSDEDTPFLDSDMYMEFENNLQPDGSLRSSGPDFSSDNNQQTTTGPLQLAAALQPLLANPNPQVPDGYYGNDGGGGYDDSSLQGLLDSSKKNPPKDPQEIYKEIMREEEGFLEQTSQFQEFLLNDDDKKRAEASFNVRKDSLRQEQLETLEKLNREMEEMGEFVEQQSTNVTLATCKKCKCFLTQLDMHHPSGMCSTCYGENISDNSDMRFLQNPEGGAGSYRYNRNRKIPPPRPPPAAATPPKQAAAAPQTPPPPPPPPPSSNNNNNSNESKEISLLRRQMQSLQRQVKRYKRQAENAEQKVIELRNTVADLQDELKIALGEGEWEETVDPDTGETFYWNEATGDMKWDL